MLARGAPIGAAVRPAFAEQVCPLSAFGVHSIVWRYNTRQGPGRSTHTEVERAAATCSPFAYCSPASTFILALPFCHTKLTAKKPPPSSYVRELKTLGDHLRRKRVLLGLRQSDVATHVAISPSTLERWERNETEPKPYLIPRIIEFLGYAPWTAPATFGEWLAMVRRANG